MLGWVFWLASPFIRVWHRHRVVLACTPYGWVVSFNYSTLKSILYLTYVDIFNSPTLHISKYKCNTLWSVDSCAAGMFLSHCCAVFVRQLINLILSVQLAVQESFNALLWMKNYPWNPFPVNRKKKRQNYDLNYFPKCHILRIMYLTYNIIPQNTLYVCWVMHV